MAKFVDITGQKFGRLTVDYLIKRRVNGVSHVLWHCTCDCGGETITTSTSLKSGKTQSCGCLRRQRTSDACRKDISGNRYGKLTVIKRISSIGEPAKYLCKCDCNNQIEVLGKNLTTGNTTSCGCYKKGVTALLKQTHGLSSTRLYNIYGLMKARCYKTYSSRYKDYGARGIRICDEWLNDFNSFYDWALNNGYEDNLTIDRIDNDGNYEPSNCQWITRGENSSKRNYEYWEKKRQQKAAQKGNKICTSTNQ